MEPEKDINSKLISLFESDQEESCGERGDSRDDKELGKESSEKTGEDKVVQAEGLQNLGMRASSAAVPPNVLALDKLGVKPVMPPLDLSKKYKKEPSGKSKKARNFQLTLNEVDKFEEVKKYLLGLKQINYIIACQEVAPTTGHIHNHIYCQFNSPSSLNIKKLCGAHIEEAFGSPEQNINYIKKVDEPEKRGEIIFEWGEVRKNRNLKKITLKEAKEVPLEELESGLSLYNYKAYEYIKTQKANVVENKGDHKKVKVVYIWGPSGSGKTLWAQYQFRNIPYNNVKKTGDFWHGVSDGVYAALYDDWRDSHMIPSEFIHFIDYTCHNINIKGGSVKNIYKYIIITSVQNPHEIYPYSVEKDEEPKKQWLRRLKIIYAPDVMTPAVKMNYMKELGWADEEDDDEDDPFKGLNFK